MRVKNSSICSIQISILKKFHRNRNLDLFGTWNRMFILERGN